MSRSAILIVGGVVVLGLVGGGVFLATKDDSSNNSESTTQSTNGSLQATKTNDESKVDGNLQSISSGNKARQCTFSYSGPNGNGQGSMFTDGKGRGLMTTEVTTERGNVGQSNTLITADKAYSWTTTDGRSFGFILDKEKLNSGNTSSSANSGSQDAGKNFSMDCKGWSVDETKLAPPKDITFSALPG